MKNYIISIIIFFLIIAAIVITPLVMADFEIAKADELCDDYLVDGKYIAQGLYPAKWFSENRICLRYDGPEYAIVEVTDEFGKTWGHWQWKVKPGDKVMVYIPDGMYLNINRGALTIVDDMTWMEADK